MNKWVEYGQSKVKLLFSFQNVLSRLIQKKYFPLIVVYRGVEDLKNLEQPQEQINYLQDYLAKAFEEVQETLYEQVREREERKEREEGGKGWRVMFGREV